MKKLLCRTLTKIERSLGIKPPIVTVLGYHSISNDKTIIDITPENFEAQISFLKSKFQFVTLDRMVAYINGEFEPEKPCVILTFDDGYADIVQNVAPILSRQHIPAALFFLAQPNLVNRNELSVSKKLMTTQRVRELHKAGWTIGCHSATHANLLKANLKVEVADAKRKLENELEIEVKYFAYPKGIYNNEIIQAVKSAGFKAAFTTGGPILTNTDLYTIARIGVDKTHSIAEFSAFFTNWATAYFKIKTFIEKPLIVSRHKASFIIEHIWNRNMSVGKL